MKVKCEECKHYFLFRNLSEPKGFCKNDDALPFGVYEGKNWRLGERYGETLRYCKFFEGRSK